jgi:hypothetical protein
VTLCGFRAFDSLQAPSYAVFDNKKEQQSPMYSRRLLFSNSLATVPVFAGTIIQF